MDASKPAVSAPMKAASADGIWVKSMSSSRNVLAAAPISAAVAAISGRDYQLIQGYVMWMGCIYVLVNLLVDISYQWLDPRIRRGALQHEE